MVCNCSKFESPTRRNYVKYSATIVSGSLLAGCTTGEDVTDASGGGSESTDSYTVSMEPAGDVTFDRTPERWVAYDGGYADMAVALGRANGMAGIGGRDRYYTHVYDELPGVGVAQSVLEDYPEVRTKEEFYELDCDVHLYDPELLINWFGWDDDDVAEIADRVGPFVGNLIFRRSDEWHDYRYYTLYEAFQKIAEVFQAKARYDAFAELHDEFIAEIHAQLPPEEERPNVLVTYNETEQPDSFSPYRLNDGGTSTKQWRDLGPTDALKGTGIDHLSTTERGNLDYEWLLEVDPDVILVRGHERKSAADFRNTVLAYMREHSAGNRLESVRNGRVYRGGYLNQGPIHNLFLTERGAKQLYPEIFGEVTGDAELFDRERIADIINGDF